MAQRWPRTAARRATIRPGRHIAGTGTRSCTSSRPSTKSSTPLVEPAALEDLAEHEERVSPRPVPGDVEPPGRDQQPVGAVLVQRVERRPAEGERCELRLLELRPRRLALADPRQHRGRLDARPRLEARFALVEFAQAQQQPAEAEVPPAVRVRDEAVAGDLRGERADVDGGVHGMDDSAGGRA